MASPGDAAAIHAIYAPLVASTGISFETRAPSIEEMQKRIATTLAHYPWLVAIDDRDQLLGYAYAGAHRAREAYQWSVDVSVYVAAGAHRLGTGRRLYRALFGILRVQGFVNAYAGIALPNQASIALHEALGFKPIGVYRNVGFKLGAWRDVGWYQLALGSLPAQPSPILAFSSLSYETVDPQLDQ
ncbi:arsinothricin resistance N-acetyltransferase ArsN1 family B [Hydrocarboniphaga sp.]|uniref:arsinothricin resistance N-acetyltransferase ArsN1 family B n=1 Tax=Hydrocarboniphaga sp. TaxID=2033016 RepID=UPI003456FF4D